MNVFLKYILILIGVNILLNVILRIPFLGIFAYLAFIIYIFYKMNAINKSRNPYQHSTNYYNKKTKNKDYIDAEYSERKI